MLNEVSDLYVSVEQEAEEMLIDFFQTLFQYVEVALKGENHANILAIINENMEVDENERN